MTEKQQKNKKYLAKIILIFSLIIIAFFTYKTYDFKEFEEKRSADLADIKNVEKEIFEFDENKLIENQDFVDEDQNHYDNHNLNNLTVEKLQQGGAEFIYQLLLHNQHQIKDLQKNIKKLEQDVLKYKSRKKINLMALSYVQLRNRVFEGKQYKNLLKSFELLTTNDEILRKKVIKLKENIENYVTYQDLQKDFSTYLPTLIALKNYERKGNIIDRIKFKLAKIITLRNLDENDPNIDGAIVKIEKSLKQHNCQNAIIEIKFLEEKYRKALIEFTKKIDSTCLFEKSDSEIILHLESLIK